MNLSSLISIAIVIATGASSCMSSTPASAEGPVLTGVWAGPHAALTVAADSAQIEFDCGRGEIGAPLRVDRAGAFAVDGVMVQEHGGPVRIGEELPRRPARYSGKVTGSVMTLDVMFSDTREPVGSFTL